MAAPEGYDAEVDAALSAPLSRCSAPEPFQYAADARADLQLADVEDAAECGGIDLERGAVRGMRAFRRGSCASRAGSVSGGCWVGGGWVSVCNRYNVVGGEQRRELDDRLDLELGALEVSDGAGREYLRAFVGVVLEVKVCVVFEARLWRRRVRRRIYQSQ